MSGETEHIPVLLDEVIAYLRPRDGGRYVDATAGAGGHSQALLAHSSPSGRLLAIDVDGVAVERVRSRLSAFGARATVVRGNFRRIGDIAAAADTGSVDGILFDFGFSTLQLEHDARGISFQRDEPLDMRFDRTAATPTAAGLLLALGEPEIEAILRDFGEEPAARRIARMIVERRRAGPIGTTAELREVVHRAVGGRRGRRTDPATRTFQALRIATNDELGAIEEALPAAIGLLVPGGRVAAISFQSLEDRIVKRCFQTESRDCVCPPGLPACRCGHRASLRVVTPKPITASASELAHNPRARSAKLRVAEKLAA